MAHAISLSDSFDDARSGTKPLPGVRLPAAESIDRDRAIRVLVADSTRMGSQLLSDALRGDPRFYVSSVCTHSHEILETAVPHKPDVAIVSMNLDDQPARGFDISPQLRARQLETKVIMLLDSSDRDLVTRAFGSGARGIFCRTQSIETLRKCICSVHSGQVWASSEELRFVLEKFAETATPRLVNANGVALLSKREQDVVRCVTEALSNREIAHKLKLSEHTVKNYIFRIFDKLGVSTRVEMVLYALSQRSLGQSGGDVPPRGSNPAWDSIPEIERYRKIAEEGVGLAPFRLGEMYREGQGIAKDKIGSYMWFLIAESMGRDLCHRTRLALKSMDVQINQQDAEKAAKMAAEWLARHGGRAPLSAVRKDGGESGVNSEKRTALEGSTAPAKPVARVPRSTRHSDRRDLRSSRL